MTAPRAGARDAVSLDARCQVGERDPESVAVTDLDARGCCVRGMSAGVTKTDAVALWLGTVGPVAARLRWVKRGGAGLAFDEPLDPARLAQALTTATPVAAPRVVALRTPLA